VSCRGGHVPFRGGLAVQRVGHRRPGVVELLDGRGGGEPVAMLPHDAEMGK
jgi:hypothetical protein